jgi:methionine-rich copper-binding protein CopC
MLFIKKVSLFHVSVLVMVFFLLISSVIEVSAHGVEVLKSDPAEGSVLQQSPSQVKVFFNEELKAGESTLQVLNSKGDKVDLGNGGVDLDDPDHASMKVDVSSLPTGIYLVNWHVVLTDGDASDGQFNFTVGQVSPAESSYPPPDISSQTVGQSLPLVSSYPPPDVSSQTVGQSSPADVSYPAPIVSSPKVSTSSENQTSKVSSTTANRWLVPGVIGGIVLVIGIIGMGIYFLRRK